ncbi:MAG: Sec-independent protein translocase protein TatB [Parvibaculales bacterium]
MFDLGWTEILFLSLVALLVLGPKELPAVLRNIGLVTGRLRALAGEFKNSLTQLEDEVEAAAKLQEDAAAKPVKPKNKNQSKKAPDLFSQDTSLSDDKDG